MTLQECHTYSVAEVPASKGRSGEQRYPWRQGMHSHEPELQKPKFRLPAGNLPPEGVRTIEENTLHWQCKNKLKCCRSQGMDSRKASSFSTPAFPSQKVTAGQPSWPTSSMLNSASLSLLILSARDLCHGPKTHTDTTRKTGVAAAHSVPCPSAQLLILICRISHPLLPYPPSTVSQ